MHPHSTKGTEQHPHFFFTNNLNREKNMNLTKNSKGELYDLVQKRKKWVKYLILHLHKEKPTTSEIENLIKWSEITIIQKETAHKNY
jgi:hypothetical protein